MDLSKLCGIVPPIVTPIDENEKVNEAGFRKLLRHCVDVGIHSIFVAGTNGETMGLTQTERNRAIKIALDEVSKDVPVICGAMDTSTSRVIENIKAIEDMGGEVAVVTPPFYCKTPTEAEMINHFETVANATKLKIMIYNIPGFTGTRVSNNELFKLAQIDNIIGYKDSTGSFADFVKVLDHFKGTGFKVFQGMTDLAPMSLLMGADGFVPTLAPVYYELYLKLYNAAKAKDFNRVMELNHLVLESNRAASFSKNGVVTNKYIVSTLGFFDYYPVKPSIGPTEEEKKKIDAFVQDIIEKSKTI